MKYFDWLYDLSLYSIKMDKHIGDIDLLFKTIILVVIFIMSIDKKGDVFINILLGISIFVSVIFPGFYDLLLGAIESLFNSKLPRFFYSDLMNTMLYHFILIPTIFISLYIVTFRFLNIKRDLGYR